MSGGSTNSADLLTSFGVGALAIVAAIAKGDQWRNPKTGDMNAGLLISGIATALVMAAIVRAAGVHYGIESWVQVAGSGVLCYVGPDPIIRAIGGLALKRFGVQDDGKQDNAKP